ncbi:hypothetical protein XIS1_610057 [Xenorhabdus innexi]|uniref:Uncharacterized protein n=1 Tax=Xenorhabdus innexi TaxID=290109 RepID=A0A1N6MZY1_9GAMM|nr:hypothetical protein XIS1_610057 [Xenorhabdus innexi]
MLPERIKNQAVYTLSFLLGINLMLKSHFTDDNSFQVVKKFPDVISKVFLT